MNNTSGLYDIHCHFVPGVDDGSDSIEESLWLLEQEYNDGVRTILVTPHFRYEMFEPPMDLVKKQFRLLKEASSQKFGSSLRLYLGCELHISQDMTDQLDEGNRLTLANSDYVLTEFSTYDSKNTIREHVQKLTNRGYFPIIAHIERYESVFGDYEFMKQLRSLGAKIQINADSVCGVDGFSMKRYTKKLMKNNLVDYIASDGHDRNHRAPHLGKAYQTTLKWMGEDYANELFITNPRKIIDFWKKS
ncbi:MAG: capsular biosynthesis protein [Eubacteriales bacterium]|nr:capsular biosynthesis protein [Eubacteriales bacterium]